MSYPEGSLSLVGGKPHLENWVLFQAPHFTGGIKWSAFSKVRRQVIRIIVNKIKKF